MKAMNFYGSQYAFMVDADDIQAAQELYFLLRDCRRGAQFFRDSGEIFLQDLRR